jgi:hypothetical protein
MEGSGSGAGSGSVEINSDLDPGGPKTYQNTGLKTFNLRSFCTLYKYSSVTIKEVIVTIIRRSTEKNICLKTSEFLNKKNEKSDVKL